MVCVTQCVCVRGGVSDGNRAICDRVHLLKRAIAFLCVPFYWFRFRFRNLVQQGGERMESGGHSPRMPPLGAGPA